jgi:hypothetical protein
MSAPSPEKQPGGGEIFIHAGSYNLKISEFTAALLSG